MLAAVTPTRSPKEPEDGEVMAAALAGTVLLLLTEQVCSTPPRPADT